MSREYFYAVPTRTVTQVTAATNNFPQPLDEEEEGTHRMREPPGPRLRSLQHTDVPPPPEPRLSMVEVAKDYPDS